MKPLITLALTLAGAMLCVTPLSAQQAGGAGPADGPLTESPRSSRQNQKTGNQQLPANSAPPRSDDESSSESTRIDLSPPMGDLVAHPDGGHIADDALKMHEWNPMRAMKDVEIGDYYYKQGNFKAALSRFREALEYKPRDAVATFKLAQALEKSKNLEEARLRYEEYLAILKDGPSAAEARKALERLKKP
jgi:tetratricopeptide (TPR) repeat protein